MCYCGPYLVYELLHPLHGVVSLQQRSHSHEPFIAALLFHFLFLFLLLLASSPFIFIYSSVLVALWDGLPRQETVISLEWTGRRHFLIFGQRAPTFSFHRHFIFWWIKEVKCDWKTEVAIFNLDLIIHDAHVVHTIIIDPSLYDPALNMQMRVNMTIEAPWRFIIYHLLTRDVQQTNCGIRVHVVLSLHPVMHQVVVTNL